VCSWNLINLSVPKTLKQNPMWYDCSRGEIKDTNTNTETNTDINTDTNPMWYDLWWGEIAGRQRCDPQTQLLAILMVGTFWCIFICENISIYPFDAFFLYKNIWIYPATRMYTQFLLRTLTKNRKSKELTSTQHHFLYKKSRKFSANFN